MFEGLERSGERAQSDDALLSDARALALAGDAGGAKALLERISPDAWEREPGFSTLPLRLAQRAETLTLIGDLDGAFSALDRLSKMPSYWRHADACVVEYLEDARHDPRFALLFPRCEGSATAESGDLDGESGGEPSY